jgi:hypothetical protein
VERLSNRYPCPAQLAIRDRKLIDGTMARMAEVLGLTITRSITAAGGCVVHGIHGPCRAADGAGQGTTPLG